MPAVAKVAGDAVARHERLYHRKPMTPPVCPNGHEFPAALTVPCEQCEASVVCIPHAEGLRLHELLTQSETAIGEIVLYAKKLTLDRDKDLKTVGADILDIVAMFDP